MLCSGCLLTLKEPYIHCVDCTPPVDFCLQCFAKGREFNNHLNCHSYEIKSISFVLFDSKWSAREELKLLDATEEYGFGNWSEISKKVQTKSSEECERHYMKHYVEEPVASLPQFEVNREHCWRKPKTFEASDQPPRPDITKPDDTLFPVGYSAPRGDFIVEYDNFSELDVKDAEIDDSDELVTELNIAATDIYLTRLKDRQLRRRIVRDYGLLDIASTSALAYQYGRQERILRDDFRRFARLTNPDYHEKLTQSMLYQKHLEQKITQLQEYRSVGLKFFRDVVLYQRLKNRRKLFKPTNVMLDEALLHAENPVACRVWLQRQMNGRKSYGMPNLPFLQRKPLTPLDLTGVPGAELLNEEEKKLCSSLRILPNSFLSYRNILERESAQYDGVKLRTARNLLKIDVNKTKRLHEFLLSHGYIKDQVK